MKRALLCGCLFGAAFSAQAQTCQGGLYLNPQVIRGEGASQTESALRELIEFVRPSGLSVAPVLNVKETEDVVASVKKPSPPTDRPVALRSGCGRSSSSRRNRARPT